MDVILGGAFTRVDGRWLLNADVLSKINSEDDIHGAGTRLQWLPESCSSVGDIRAPAGELRRNRAGYEFVHVDAVLPDFVARDAP